MKHVIMDGWTRSLLFDGISMELDDISLLHALPRPPSFGVYARWIASVVEGKSDYDPVVRPDQLRSRDEGDTNDGGPLGSVEETLYLKHGIPVRHP